MCDGIHCRECFRRSCWNSKFNHLLFCVRWIGNTLIRPCKSSDCKRYLSCQNIWPFRNGPRILLKPGKLLRSQIWVHSTRHAINGHSCITVEIKTTICPAKNCISCDDINRILNNKWRITRIMSRWQSQHELVSVILNWERNCIHKIERHDCSRSLRISKRERESHRSNRG